MSLSYDHAFYAIKKYAFLTIKIQSDKNKCGDQKIKRSSSARNRFLNLHPTFLYQTLLFRFYFEFKISNEIEVWLYTGALH